MWVISDMTLFFFQYHNHKKRADPQELYFDFSERFAPRLAVLYALCE
jgi:hypothetical protein